MSQRTALYRLFESSGSLLYIGITNNVERRFAHHRRHKDWWPLVDHDRTVIVWYTTREEAELTELAAIRDELPRHNIVTSDENGCAHFLPAPTGRRWGRPGWDAEQATEEQRRLVDSVVDAFRLREEFRRQGYALVRAVQVSGVPMEYIARLIKAETGFRISPATAYRHMPTKDRETAESDDAPTQ